MPGLPVASLCLGPGYHCVCGASGTLCVRLVHFPSETKATLSSWKRLAEVSGESRNGHLGVDSWSAATSILVWLNPFFFCLSL